jgi:hypothetical protein
MTKYHIKPYLKERGFNLSALASSMDMSFQRFDHHLKIKDDLSLKFIISLSKKMDMTIEDFLEKVTINTIK